MWIAVMQPTYLPWIGYFDLMDRVDTFVLLDDVQFSKQSWQQRNRIKGTKALSWLSVPVLHKGRAGQLIHETRIRDPHFWRKHLRSIEMSYAKAAHCEELLPELRSVYGRGDPWQLLVELNVALIEWMKGAFGIDTPVVRSSDLPSRDNRRHRVPDLCRALGGTHYLSPAGSADYLLAELDAYRDQQIEVAFHVYEHPTYRQLHGDFCAHASALDLLLNHGPNALAILRSGRRPSLAPDRIGPSKTVGV